MAYLSPFVADGLNTLSDEDSSDDADGFDKLRKALASAGDKEATLAAAASHRMCNFRQAVEGDAVGTGAASNPLQCEERVCDLCYYLDHEPILPPRWVRADQNMNLCEICNADLCDPCLEKIKARSAGHVLICDASHSWIRIPPLSDEQQKTTRPDQVIFRDQIVSLKEYTSELGSKWGVERV